jgi:ABC-type Fe3+ transport system permease subunit/DNA-binding beta-propeller fold protein YncE
MIFLNWRLLANSVAVSAAATLLSALMGIAVALLATSLPRRLQHFCAVLAVTVLALPPFVVTNCWLHYLGHMGVWRRWIPLDVYSFPGVIWILALLFWPVTFLLVWSAWSRIETPQLEADPAVTGHWFLRGILLPIARPVLAQAGVLSFILAANNFAVPAILQVKVAPAEMWVLFNSSFDTPGSVKIIWPLVAILVLLTLFLMRQRVVWQKHTRSCSPELFRRHLGPRWLTAAALIGCAIFGVSIFLPIIQLSSANRTWTELPGAFAAGRHAILNSMLFAGVSSTTVIGVALVVIRTRGRQVRSGTASLGGAIEMVLWLPFLLPGVVLGICLINIFNHEWSVAFYQSFGIVFLALIVRYFGPGLLASGEALKAADRDLVDAALIEGASRWQLFRHAYWPQIGGRLSAAWYIVFLLCLWDVETLILVIPPGAETMPIRIFNFLHYGHNPQVNALCLILLLIAIAPLLLVRVFGVFNPPARTILWAFLAFLCAPFLSGCKPARASGQYPIQSTIFESVEIIGTRGVGVGQFNKPRSLALDTKDNLYVVDMTGRIQKFSPGGKFILQWQMPQTELGKPKGMGRDLDGNIIVVEPHYQRINVFSPEGRLLSQWGRKGTNVGQFTLPRGAAVNSHNEIYVSEYTAMERVQRFQLPPRQAQTPASTNVLRDMPEVLNAFGKAGNAPGDFNRPEGLCVDAAGFVHVADSCNHRIEVFSRDGTFVRAFGKAGTGLGEFSYPYDICVDRKGRQYVCEFGNSRIQIFDKNDRPIEIIGNAGGEPGEFSNPWCIALDSAENLYVTDLQNHRVQKLIRRKRVEVVKNN